MKIIFRPVSERRVSRLSERQFFISLLRLRKMLITLSMILVFFADHGWAQKVISTNPPPAVSLQRYQFYKQNLISIWPAVDEKVIVTMEANDPDYPLEYQMFSPAGIEVEEGIVAPHQKQTISFVSKEDGPYLIRCYCFSAPYSVDVDSRPWVFAVASGRKTFATSFADYPGDPMYFFLPKGHDKMKWWMRYIPAGGHVKLIAPGGKIYLDETYDKQTYFDREINGIPIEDQNGIWRWETKNVPGSFMGGNVADFYSPDRASVALYAERVYGQPLPPASAVSSMKKGSHEGLAAQRLTEKFDEPLHLSCDEPEFGTRCPLLHLYDPYCIELFFAPASYLERLRQGRPHLMNVVRNIPFQSAGDFGGPLIGDNHYVPYSPANSFGKDKYACASPREAALRLARLQEMTASIHKLGIPYIQGYVNSSWLAVDPKNSNSINAVYDRWSEYDKVLSLGPKPALPPEEWIRKNEEQQPAAWRNQVDKIYPEMIHIMVCPNNPGYLRWSEVIASLAARAGINGFHMDSTSSRVCFCSYCRPRFVEYLKQKYSATQLRALFGFAKDEDIHLSNNPQDRLLRAESIRFMAHSMANLFKTIISAGQTAARGKRFMVDICGHYPTPDEEPENIFSSMCENGFCHMGMNELSFFEGRAYLRYFDDIIYDEKMTLSAAGTLPRDKRPRMSPVIVRTLGASEYTARLSCAESAAFGDGTLCFVGPHLPYVFKMYGCFFSKHKDIYSGYFSAAPVAIIGNRDYYGDDSVVNYPIHETYARYVLNAMSKRHIPADMINAQFMSREELQRRRLIFATQYRYVPVSELQLYYNYVESGGTLVFDSAFAEWDEWFNLRKTEFPWGNKIGENSPYTATFGKGRVICVGNAFDKVNTFKALDEVFPKPVCAIRGEPARALSGIRSAIYQKQVKDNAIITMHLVNYNILNENGIYRYTESHTYQREPAQPVEIANIKIQLDLGQMGWREYILKNATVFSPDFEISPKIQCDQKGSVVEINIPELYIYNIIELELALKTKTTWREKMREFIVNQIFRK